MPLVDPPLPAVVRLLAAFQLLVVVQLPVGALTLVDAELPAAVQLLAAVRLPVDAVTLVDAPFPSVVQLLAVALPPGANPINIYA